MFRRINYLGKCSCEEILSFVVRCGGVVVSIGLQMLMPVVVVVDVASSPSPVRGGCCTNTTERVSILLKYKYVGSIVRAQFVSGHATGV